MSVNADMHAVTATVSHGGLLSGGLHPTNSAILREADVALSGVVTAHSLTALPDKAIALWNKVSAPLVVRIGLDIKWITAAAPALCPITVTLFKCSVYFLFLSEFGISSHLM